MKEEQKKLQEAKTKAAGKGPMGMDLRSTKNLGFPFPKPTLAFDPNLFKISEVCKELEAIFPMG